MTIIGFFQLDELMGGDPYFAPDHSFAGALSGPLAELAGGASVLAKRAQAHTDAGRAVEALHLMELRAPPIRQTAMRWKRSWPRWNISLMLRKARYSTNSAGLKAGSSKRKTRWKCRRLPCQWMPERLRQTTLLPAA